MFQICDNTAWMLIWSGGNRSVNCNRFNLIDPYFFILAVLIVSRGTNVKLINVMGIARMEVIAALSKTNSSAGMAL